MQHLRGYILITLLTLGGFTMAGWRDWFGYVPLQPRTIMQSDRDPYAHIPHGVPLPASARGGGHVLRPLVQQETLHFMQGREGAILAQAGWLNAFTPIGGEPTGQEGGASGTGTGSVGLGDVGSGVPGGAAPAGAGPVGDSGPPGGGGAGSGVGSPGDTGNAGDSI
jgi:hypothetical protein